MQTGARPAIESGVDQERRRLCVFCRRVVGELARVVGPPHALTTVNASRAGSIAIRFIPSPPFASPVDQSRLSMLVIGPSRR